MCGVGENGEEESKRRVGENEEGELMNREGIGILKRIFSLRGKGESMRDSPVGEMENKCQCVGLEREIFQKGSKGVELKIF